MKGNRGIFVKVNYKNIGELNSFIYDSMNGINKNKSFSIFKLTTGTTLLYFLGLPLFFLIIIGCC